MVEMWQRRLEFGLFIHIANAFRHSHPHMARMEVPQIAELAQSSKPKAVEAMARIDRELENRAFIAGDRFSVADISGLVALDFARTARIAIPEEFGQLRRWHASLVGAAERQSVNRGALLPGLRGATISGGWRRDPPAQRLCFGLRLSLRRRSRRQALCRGAR